MGFKREHLELLDKIVLARATFDPPFKASSSLENEARFVHVVKGNSRLYVPKEQLNIGPSDSFFMKCENFVNNWSENEDNEPNEIIIIHFYPEVLQFIYNGQMPDLFSFKNEANPNPVERIPINGLISNYIESLRSYFDNPSFVTDELIRIKLKELILILVKSDQSGRIKAILSDLFQSNEYEFKEIIHSNLYEDLGIQDLAFFTGLSLSSFKRKFKTVFGTSPGSYIKTKRLEKAKNLLEKTNQRISEIAFDCGFNDVGYFSKSFAAGYNNSPTEYRKNYLNQISG